MDPALGNPTGSPTPPSARAGRPPGPGWRSADRLAGLVIMLVGVWFLWQAFAIPERAGAGAVGPRVFPIAIGLGILASGLVLALSGPARAEGADKPGEGAERADWPTLLGLAALLALYIVAFFPLGFPIASALFLVAGARVLGSRAWLRDVVAGLLVSIAAYLVFTRLLGLELPAGPLEEPLRALFTEPPSE